MNETSPPSPSPSNNETDRQIIAKRLQQIDEQLSSISAKEVLFIITLSFLALFAAVNMCLLILERRNKRKQNSVPQAIVIQPNTSKSDGSNKKSAPKSAKVPTTSSNYEKDVLPSKSMKMKVSISPSMSAAKKPTTKAPSSKESFVEDSSKASEVEKKSKLAPLTPIAPEPVMNNPYPPNPITITLDNQDVVPPPPSSNSEKSGEKSMEKAAEKPIEKANDKDKEMVIKIEKSGEKPVEKIVEKPVEKTAEKPPAKPEKSEKSESSTSFTVPDGAMSPKPLNPKDVATPTETTLSGAGTPSKANQSTASAPPAKEALQTPPPAALPQMKFSSADVPRFGSVFGPGPVLPPPPNFPPPPSSEKKN